MQLVESARIRSQTTGLLRAMDHFNEGIMLVNMGLPNWDIVFVNEAWTQLTGMSGLKRVFGCCKDTWQFGFVWSGNWKPAIMGRYNVSVVSSAFFFYLMCHMEIDN